MTVQSRDIKARSSHVVTAEQMNKAEPWLRRGIAALLWLFSYFGNVLMFVGGWSHLGWNDLTAKAVGIGLVYQAVCTIVQFICCKHWYNPLYLLALTASAAPAFVGYYPIIVEPLTQYVPFALACAGVGGVLVAADIIPERTFVKH